MAPRREPHSGPTGPPPLVTAPQCCTAPGSRAFRCRTPCATSSHISSCRPAAAPSLHPPPEQISPDPEALLHALAKRIWCSASFSPGNTLDTKSASPRRAGTARGHERPAHNELLLAFAERSL